MYNQQQLGFGNAGMQADPFNQILVQAQQISMQSYPQVPPIAWPFRNAALSQLMIAQTAAAIQNFANESPFHRWLFNMCGQNNWNNDYWRKIGQLSPWALHFYILSSNYNGNAPESLIPQVSQTWVMNAAAMVFLDQQFSNYALQMVQNDMNAANHWRGQANILQQIMNMPAQAQQQMMGGNVGNQNMIGGGNMTNMNAAMQGVTGGGLFTTTPQVTVSAGGDVGGRFNRQPATAPQQQSQPSQQPKEVHRQPQEAVVSQQESQDVFIEYGQPGCPDWYPNEAHPVLPAISPLTHKLTIQIDNGGNPAPVVIQRDPNEMDYEKHVIPTGLGRPYRDSSSQQIRNGLVSIENSINKMDGDARDVKEIDPTVELSERERSILASSTVDPDIRLVDDLNIGWLVARASRSRLSTMPLMYRTTSSVVRPILVSVSQMNLIDNLADSATLSQLADRLRGAVPVTKEDENEDKMTVINAVNEEMTAAVNRVLLMNLSFRTDQLSISNFMEDYNDMVTAMNDGVGERFVKALQENEKEIIYSIFNTDLLSEEDMGEYINGLVGEFDGKMTGVVHLLGSVVSTTLVRVRAHELNFMPFTEHSGVLFEDANPLLFGLAEALFSENQKVVANRHLVQTIDGVTLEFTRSYMTKLPQVTVLK